MLNQCEFEKNEEEPQTERDSLSNCSMIFLFEEPFLTVKDALESQAFFWQNLYSVLRPLHFPNVINKFDWLQIDLNQFLV